MSIEWWANVRAVADIAAQTSSYLSSSQPHLAVQLADHISAYNATGDVIPFFGDYRLPYSESFFQLRNSVSLAFHGFYSQSFSVLRSVCELSLLQSSLPEGAIRTEEGVNWVWLLGQRAIKSPSSDVASSIEAWAVDGCKIPPWRDMLKKLLRSDIAREFDQKTKLSARLKEIFDGTNQYVHVRGWQRSAINLRNGGLRLSEESLLLFGTHMMRATQMSISILLLAFLPTATSYADAAAGFIDGTQLSMALRVLPKKDAELFRQIHDNRER
jgi:hypothetical protein